MPSLIRSGLPLTAVLLLSAASLAAPGGLYSAAPPAPAKSSDAPVPREQEHSVSSDGGARYSVPFTVPPGRAGAQPSIALVYSSRAPLRGGIAAGWTLPVPTISVDTSHGRMQGLHYQVDGRALIMVNEPAAPVSAIAYRADGDGDYTRYEHVTGAGEAGYWIARRLDGSVSLYGVTAGSRDERTEGTPSSGVYGGQGRWFLSSFTDAQGNVIDYSYETVLGNALNGSLGNTPVDIALKRIEYGRNARDKTSEHHAKIEFVWQNALSTCPGSFVPIGAQFSYATGIRRYEGARKLLSIVSFVKNTPGGAYDRRRELALGYDAAAEDCSAQHAPLRQLVTVQERAWTMFDPTSTPSVALPPTTFTYGPTQYSYDAVSDDWVDSVSSGKNALANDKPGGWPATDSSFMDIDGSGAPSVLAGSLCEELPRMPYANGSDDQPAPYGSPDYLASWEGCSLAAQVTHRQTPRTGFTCGKPANFYGYHFLDVNGDGRPDLIGALDYQKGGYRPSEDPAVAGDYPDCSTLPTPPCRSDADEPVACFFAPVNQRVWPMDTSYGPGSNGVFIVAPNGGAGGAGAVADLVADPGADSGAGGVFLQPTGSTTPVTGAGGLDPSTSSSAGTGGSTDTCPDDTCMKWHGCIGSPGECCKPEYCNHEGSPLDPPVPNALDQAYQGNPGGHVYETQGIPPEAVFTHCGHVPDLHCGWYVYRVYYNVSDGQGGPVFDPAPHLVRSPVPIDGMEMASAGGLGPMGNASAWRAIVDLDGDDRPDAIYQRPNYMRSLQDTQPESLQVWLGSESGVDPYAGSWDGTALRWSAPASVTGTREMLDASDELTDARSTGFESLARYFRTQRERVSLHDINGDGLLDLVRREPVNTSGWLLRVFYNTGSGFEDGPGTILSTTLPAMSQRVRWLAKEANGLPAGEIELSIMAARPMDLDGDGLLDVVGLPEPGPNGEGHLAPLAALPGAITAHYSTGDRFIAVDATAQLGAWRAALAQVTVSEDLHYRSLTDVADEDGDGLPDMLMPSMPGPQACSPPLDAYSFYLCGLFMQVHHAARQPLRLLRKVENGLGAQVEFTYASMRDESVVPRDAAHARTSPLWVVSSVSAGIGSVTATTEHRYQNPVHGPDRQGRVGFRGFESTVETGPPVASGRRQRNYAFYRYDLDEEGLVDHELVAEVMPGGEERLESISESTYEQTPLFDARLRVYQDADAIVSTCGGAVLGPAPDTVAACIADPSTTVARMARSWVPRIAGFLPVAWAVEHTRRLPTRADSTQGVRHETTAFELRYAAEKYHLLSVEGRVLDENQEQLARVTTQFDAIGNPVVSMTSVDDTTEAVTTRTFDLRGNVVSVVRPNQQGTALQLSQDYTYDEFGVFPRTLTNELGQTTTNVQDLATGAVLLTRGVSTNGATPITESRIDGLGRVVVRNRGVDYGAFDTSRKVFMATYVDVGVRSVTTETLLEEPVEVWVEDATILDALGRVVQEEQRSAQGNRVITRGYDVAGRPVAVTVPGPSGTGNQTYGTQYDGLGRVVRTTSPLTAPVDTAYQGSTTVVSQTSTDGTPSSQRVAVRDAFDRVISVSEGINAPAATGYAYDEADRVVEIVDPDGIGTDIAYDQRGLRTQITRGASSLRYFYDLHGNRIGFIHPTGAKKFDKKRDVSEWHYDEVDRLVDAYPARRLLTDAQLKRFGNGTVAELATHYVYDEPNHEFGVGRLTTVLGAGITETFDYTAEGQVAAHYRKWTVRPDGQKWVGESRQDNTYGVGGQIVRVEHPKSGIASRYHYDDRGRPTRADLFIDGVQLAEHATLAYEVAGYVAARGTAVPASGQSWQRDAAGRVISTDVVAGWGCAPGIGGCVASPVAGEALTFDSRSRVAASSELGHALSIQFGYDERDQLVSADSPGSAAYQAAFEYTPGGRIQSADVASSLASAEVESRHVEHDYAPHGPGDLADPAAVRALRDVFTSAEVAALHYDPSGNLVERITADGELTLVYDGENRLREVAAKKGYRETYWYDHTGERVLTFREAKGSKEMRHRIGGAELFTQGPGDPAKHTTVDVSLGAAPVLRVTRDKKKVSVENLFHGGLGSLLAVTSAQAEVTARLGYGPFGEVLYAEGASVDDYDRRFNGKPEDELSGLRYYGARYYDPLTLSWTQADPYFRFVPEAALGEPLRQALYTFSLNNPLGYVDPDGLDSHRVTRQEAKDLCDSPRSACRKARAKGLSTSTKVETRGPDEEPGTRARRSTITMDVPAGAKTVVYDVYLVDHEGNYIPGTAGNWKYYGEGFQENAYSVDSWVADDVAEGGVRAIMLESSVVATAPAPSATANVRAVQSDDNGVTVRTDFGESEGAAGTSYAEVVVYDGRGRERSRWGAVPIALVTEARGAGLASNHALTRGTSDLRLMDATSRTESQIQAGIESGRVKVEINPPRDGRPSR